MSLKSVRKIAVLAVLFSVFTAGKVFAQQITKFAVVDTNRVYQAYFRNTAQLRTYDEKKAEFQAEVDSRTSELMKLQQTKSTYQKAGDTENAKKLQEQITQKSQSLTDYVNAKNVELEELKNSLQDNDEFYQNFYKTIQRIAENGGYSMVLNLQDTKSILWYSTSVDITDDVISALGLGNQ